MHCPICDTGTIEREHLKAYGPLSQELYAILECDRCGVKKTHPFPHDLASCYKTDFGKQMRESGSRLHEFMKRVLLRRELRLIKRAIGKRPYRFIDVGCGAGEFAKIIYGEGDDVIAADSDSEKPVCIRNLAIPYFTFDYDSYRFSPKMPRDSYTIILRHVLEHIRDPHLMIDRLSDIGAKDIFIVLPDINAITAKAFGRYNPYVSPPLHLWHFGEKSLGMLLARSGFRIAASGRYSIPITLLSLQLYLKVKGYDEKILDMLHCKGFLAAMSASFDALLPGHILWCVATRV